jgi:hypothetical protein
VQIINLDVVGGRTTEKEERRAICQKFDVSALNN